MAGPERINKLANILNDFDCVSKHDKPDEREGATLAHAFTDLEDSFRKFVFELLPKLTAGKLSEEDARDLLWNIGEEFRHIDYHLHDPKFYSYLWAGDHPTEPKC